MRLEGCGLLMPSSCMPACMPLYCKFNGQGRLGTLVLLCVTATMCVSRLAPTRRQQRGPSLMSPMEFTMWASNAGSQARGWCSYMNVKRSTYRSRLLGWCRVITHGCDFKESPS